MKWNGVPEQELISGLQRGSRAAITEIYRRYWNRLLAIAVNHLKDTDEAEDAVQSVFIKLWDKRDTLYITNLSAYLATAVKYTVFSALRSKKKFADLGELTIEQQHDSQENAERIYALFLQDYINGITEQLPEKCRLVFQLSRHEGMSNREISEELSIAEKTVEAHMSKALKVIRNSLRKGGILPFCDHTGLPGGLISAWLGYQKRLHLR